MQFEIIGADSENYFLMAFDEKLDMSKGVFFCKTPISFFDFIDMNQPDFFFMYEIEVYIEENYECLIEDGLLSYIDKLEFLDIVVRYEE